ncbi:MAG: DUF4433 domain-containing protein [Alphaproteobacteria bacterium]
MSRPPDAPKIYHIVHVDKLASIITDGCIWCDATVSTRPECGTTIGMNRIKERRLRLPIDCHPGDFVGDYAPFYFCPRSIMLYVIHQANHQDLAYRGGQDLIIHVEADLNECVRWAGDQGRRWAFSLSNAGANYAEFRSAIDHLGELNWKAIEARDWRAPEMSHGKQAEFLMHGSFPWTLVRRIGVRSREAYDRVHVALNPASHRPRVEIRPEWYY